MTVKQQLRSFSVKAQDFGAAVMCYGGWPRLGPDPDHLKLQIQLSLPALQDPSWWLNSKTDCYWLGRHVFDPSRLQTDFKYASNL